MRVAVGSTNPVKYSATAKAIGDGDTEIEPVSVDSGVAEQPMSADETIAGATNRAQRAYAACDVDVGVGIEGGVTAVEEVPGLFLTMWAAATDGDTVCRGGGPRIRLPEPVGERLQDGEELGPVMDDVLGTTGVAENQGAAGVLTDSIIDRESSLLHAVAGAVAPFVSEYYD